MSWFNLRVSVVFALVVGLLVPNLLFALRDGKSAEQRVLESLRGDLEQTTDILATAMRDPLWQISPELGRPMLQAMFRDERLVSVVVHEVGTDAPFLDIYRSVSATSPALSKTRPIIFDGRELGSIRVTMSAGPALDDAIREIEEYRQRMLASSVFTIVLVLIVLQWRLIRPLVRLRHRLHSGAWPAAEWDGVEELRPLAEEIDRSRRQQD